MTQSDQRNITFDGRTYMRYYCVDWPGAKDLLYADDFQKFGWSWSAFFEKKFGSHTIKQLYLTIEPDPDNVFDMLIQYQYSKSMRDTIMSLPSRTHVSGTGTNTFRVPVSDFEDVLVLLESHSDYTVIVKQEVEDRFARTAREVADIKSIADIPDSDKEQLALMHRIIDESPSISDEYELYTFQKAGVMAMLYIFGVYDKLVPGDCSLSLVDISEVTPAKEQQRLALPPPPPTLGYDENGKKVKKKKRKKAKSIEAEMVLFSSEQKAEPSSADSLESILGL